MRRVTELVVLAIGLFLVTGAAQTDTRRQLLLIRSADATARAEADTSFGQYYTLSYRLPSDLRAERLERAVLELYLDVRAKPRGEYVNEAPVVEVYALKGSFAGSVQPEKLDVTTGTMRPVALGDGRRVLIDITEIVRAHLDGTLRNDGLVVGSLTGMREGDFSLVSDKFPQGAVGRVRIYTSSQATR